MNHKRLANSILTLGVSFALTSAPVLARPGGGGRAAGPRPSGTQSRQGSFTGPQGHTGQFQGQSTVTRQPGSYQKQYEGTRTAPNGQTSSVERQTSVQKTGDNSWHRDSSQSVTGADGQTRTRSQSGDTTVQKTDDGFTRSYDGTRTNAQGQTVNVSREVDVSKNADGTVTKDRSSEVTGQDGAVLGTGQSTTTITPGQGSTTTGSHTQRDGATRTYEGSRTQDSSGAWTGERTVTGPEGRTSTARWQYLDGRWVKVAPAPETPTPQPEP